MPARYSIIYEITNTLNWNGTKIYTSEEFAGEEDIWEWCESVFMWEN